MFLGYFRAYVGQSHDHIDWATSIMFTSINLTKPKDQFLKFLETNIEDWWIEKLVFFESAILDFFLFQIFFFIPMKISQSFLASKDMLKFWWLLWFPVKNNSCVQICNTVYNDFIEIWKDWPALVLKTLPMNGC